MPDLDDFAVCAALEGVPSALAATRDGIDALLRDRGLRRTTPDLTAESLLREAVASATLDGSAASEPEVRAGTGDPVAVAAARLYGELLSLVPVIGRSPLQALARLHTLAAPPQTAREEVGRPRADPRVTARLQALSRQLVAPTRALRSPSRPLPTRRSPRWSRSGQPTGWSPGPWNACCWLPVASIPPR